MEEQTNDYLVRVLAKEAGLRALACTTTELANEARRRHEAEDVASAALAEGLTAASLVGALLKIQQRVALKFEGDGPLRKMVVESDSYGRVRGYVAAPAALEMTTAAPDTAATGIGRNGLLTVVKDLRLNDLHEGIVPLSDGQIDDDVALYLNQSEQTPSLVEIGHVMGDDGELRVAGGLLVQVLPGQEETSLDVVAERIDDLPPIGNLLHSGERPEDVLAALFAGFEYETLETRLLQFDCTCSWKRSEKALIMLGRAEIETLIAEGQAVVDCHFCHQRYIFGREALETILDKVK